MGIFKIKKEILLNVCNVHLADEIYGICEKHKLKHYRFNRKCYFDNPIRHIDCMCFVIPEQVKNTSIVNYLERKKKEYIKDSDYVLVYR